MKNHVKIWPAIHNVTTFFLASAVIFLGYSLEKRAQGDVKTDHSVKVVANKVLNSTVAVNGLRDTFKLIMHEKSFLHDTIPNPPVTLHDTLEISRRYETLKTLALKEKTGLRDSIKNYLVQRQHLAKEVSDLKEARKHLILQGAKTINKVDSNADIAVIPFKKKERQNMFSPQKNFLRVYNRVPGGTINNLPYFDYEQTNDELNLLLFQARSSFNFTNGKFQYGPGIELKLNRFSFNIAELFNSDNDPFKNPTISFGTKFDIYRIRFK